MFRGTKNQQKVISVIAIVAAMFITTACGKAKKSTAQTVTIPTDNNINTGLGGTSLPNIDLFDGTGNTSSTTGSTAPASGPLVLPNPSLNNLTPWSWMGMLMPPQAQNNDVRAMAYSGQAYRFGFSLQTQAQAQYQVTLPPTVVPSNDPGCQSPLAGPLMGPVNLCIIFTQPSLNQLMPIQIKISGQSASGALNITKNIWVLVLPGAPDKFEFVVANAGMGVGVIPPVSNRFFLDPKSGPNGGTRETIPSRFGVQLMKNGKPAALTNAQLAVEPVGAGRILGVSNDVIQLEFGVGGKVFIVAKGMDMGREVTIRGELAIPRQIALKYTRDCDDDDDRAVLVCSNNSGIPYQIAVAAAGANTSGFPNNTPAGVPLTIGPGAFNQKAGDFPVVKENKQWIASYTLTIDGNQPNGAARCDALITDDDGDEKVRFPVPGL